MFCIGYSGLADSNSVSLSPTSVENIMITTISDGTFDDLYVTSNTSDTYDKNTWDAQTIFHAKFDGDVTAGNVDYLLQNTTHIMIKRRIVNTYDWINLHSRPIVTVQDFQFEMNEFSNVNNVEYEYAVVPLNNGAEGQYSSNTIVSSFDGMILTDGTTTFKLVTDIGIDTTRNQSKTVIPTITSKYPFVIKSSKNNYDTGSISCGVLQYSDEKKDFIVGDNWAYRDSFKDFLCDNEHPLILKNDDGRIWIIEVTGNVDEPKGEYYLYPINSFEFVAIGDAKSNEDLYDNGFLDIEESLVN